ncbi:MAG: hypothetical protein WD049_03450 [Candidatus Paceibacterota bacterium]
MAKRKGTPIDADTEALVRIEACRTLEDDALDLSTLGLATLPPEIGQLKTLRKLDLSHNQLSTLPPEIGQLTG